MSDESLANFPVSEEVGLLGQAKKGLRDRAKVYIKNNWKLSVIVAVLVATVTALITHYAQPGSKSQDVPPSLLAETLPQGENDQNKYNSEAKMDAQFRDCSSEVHLKTTFPDLDYSLLGYDILYGYPLANGRDPGFRHPIFRADFSKPKQTSDCRYVVPQGFTVVPSESCVVSFESKLIRNKQQMSSHLAVQASVKGGGWGFEFSASAGYKKDTAEMSTGESLFVLSHAECQNYYSVIDFENPPPFDPSFLARAKKLANSVSDDAIMDFIEYYGTHFFSDVTYGAKFVQHHKVSQKTYESLKKSQISVEAQASYSGLFSIGGGFSLDKEQSEAASNFSKSVETTTFTMGSTPPSNGDAMTWAASVDENPVPMLYSLSAIDILFTEPFVKNLLPGDYNATRQKLESASHIYCQSLKNKGMVHSCEPHFQLESAGVDIQETGYSSLQNVDNSTCLSFCRQDGNCASVVYSELHPPFKGSVCRFFNNTVNLTLIDPAIYDPPRLSYLIILESRQKGFYLNAALEGSPFLVRKENKNDCDWHCFNGNNGAIRFFCDAYSYKITTASTGNCSLYTAKDIANIVYATNSYVRL